MGQFASETTQQVRLFFRYWKTSIPIPRHWGRYFSCTYKIMYDIGTVYNAATQNVTFKMCTLSAEFSSLFLITSEVLIPTQLVHSNS